MYPRGAGIIDPNLGSGRSAQTHNLLGEIELMFGDALAAANDLKMKNDGHGLYYLPYDTHPRHKSMPPPTAKCRRNYARMLPMIPFRVSSWAFRMLESVFIACV